MALAVRDKLQGEVEVDETFLGGVRSGGRGRGALGKAIVVIAIERKQPKGYGRVRLRIIPDASAKSLAKFLDEAIEPGATVVTDGWLPYRRQLLAGSLTSSIALPHLASKHTPSCRVSTASLRYSSVGFLGPTRARTTPTIWRNISTSSRSGSIAAGRPIEAFSSTA